NYFQWRRISSGVQRRGEGLDSDEVDSGVYRVVGVATA
ncbi:MAG: hypothetical protein PWQ22_1506, partial [Archaeoglobaceae archaeon]|nr:hypothetical protein [Archaeoglobaceae archaeon]